MKAFTAGEDHLTTAYNFDFLYADALSPKQIIRSLSAWSGAEDEAFPSWAFSNHDAPRCISRWAKDTDTADAAKFYLLLLMALRGNIFIYQGEELGLPQASVAFEDLQDPEAIANWPETLGRDGARTPMPWEKTAGDHAGFSRVKPWLPIDPRHVPLAASAQEAEEKSVLHFAREAITLRRASPALREGAIRFLDAPEGVLAFVRKLGVQELLCVFNLSQASSSLPESLQPGCGLLLAAGSGASAIADSLHALSGFIAPLHHE